MPDFHSDESYKDTFKAIFNRENGDKRLTATDFLLGYKGIIKRFIADGKPSEDTLRSYYSTIDQYLVWIKEMEANPFKISEQQIIYYRQYLIDKNYSATSIKFKLTAIRKFYSVAMKYKLISENPALEIHSQRDPDSYIPVTTYYSSEQLKEILSVLDDNDEIQLRTKTMIILMAVDGLRTVEVHRMNQEDINFAVNSIYIRDKRHNDTIYPSDLTMEYLRKYIDRREAVKASLTPVFVSTGNRSKGRRISRQKIRVYVAQALEKCKLKNPGKCCHILRHTCGSLLYAETKDIQAVKNVLRHCNVKMTSRYSHVANAMSKRYTNAIQARPDKTIAIY